MEALVCWRDVLEEVERDLKAEVCVGGHQGDGCVNATFDSSHDVPSALGFGWGYESVL